MRSAILIDDTPTPFERAVASLRIQASLNRVRARIGDDATILEIGVRGVDMHPAVAGTDGHDATVDIRFTLSTDARTLDWVVQHEILHAAVVRKGGLRIPAPMATYQEAPL